MSLQYLYLFIFYAQGHFTVKILTLLHTQLILITTCRHTVGLCDLLAPYGLKLKDLEGCYGL